MFAILVTVPAPTCSGVHIGEFKPCSTLIENLGAPFEPVFVVTRITPFAPFAPYTAVADASFRTEMLAMSVGDNIFIDRSIPSTITSGLLPFQLERPRSINVASLWPGAPFWEYTKRPETFPARALVMSEVPVFSRSSALTWVMAPTTLSLRCTP